MSQDSHLHPENYPLDPAARAFSDEQLEMIEKLSEPVCICGDLESQHIDNTEQCFVVDCGCKEFEPAENYE